MATLRSLGVKTPAGLPYLIAEGILGEDASQKDYQWQKFCYVENDNAIEEELLWTDFCVVFSRGGVTQKVFNFEVEQQKVVQAILTWFSTDGVDSQGGKRSSAIANHPDTSVPHLATLGTSTSKPAIISKVKPHASAQSQHRRQRSRALVILLKSQAHVYFLTGSSHVVNLPFEVEKAFATPHGLLLQRKHQDVTAVISTPQMPAVPPNSFLSTNNFSQPSFRLSSSFGPSFGSQKKSQPATRHAANRLLDDLLRPHSTSSDDLPRTYSFTDPLSEMGLVVDASETSLTSSRSSAAARRLEPLDNSERILYVSENDEAGASSANAEQLLLVVTANQIKRVYTIWRASYASSQQKSLIKGRRRSSGLGGKAWRRTSHGPGPGTGTTTPGVRLRDGFRESFGGAATGNPVPLAQSTRDKPGAETLRGKDVGKDAEAAFASQLDPDSNFSQQPKESRRVSSLLSRGDLSTSFDKSAFQDLAAQASFGGQAVAAARRGPSLGLHGDRTSFGASQRKHRASTPGSFARLSLGDISAADTEENSAEDNSDDALFESESVEEPFKGLRKEVGLRKIAEISFEANTPKFASSTSQPLERASQLQTKAFVLNAPLTYDRGGKTICRLYTFIVNTSSAEHTEVEISYEMRYSKSHKRRCDDLETVSNLTLGAIRRFGGHLNVIKLVDGSFTRALCLCKLPNGGYSLVLRAPWQDIVNPQFSLSTLKLFNPYGIAGASPSSRKTAGLKRTLPAPETIHAMRACTFDGGFELEDSDGSRHALQLRLAPQDNLLQQIFEALRLVLPNYAADLLLSIWINIHSDIASKPQTFASEWASFGTTLLTLPLAINHQTGTMHPVMSGLAPQSAGVPHSVSTQNNSAWSRMWHSENMDYAKAPRVANVWNWSEQAHHSSQTAQKPIDFITTCAALAEAFNETTAGQAADKKWQKAGLPHEQDVRTTYIPKILVALHLIREELKLTTMASTSHVDYVAPICAQLGQWLVWKRWGTSADSCYSLDGNDFTQWRFLPYTRNSHLNGIPQPPWDSPPSIFEWIDHMTRTHGFVPFPSLEDLIDSDPKDSSSRLHISRKAHKLTPRTYALSSYLKDLTRTLPTSPSQRVQLFLRYGIDQNFIETLPEAFAAPLQEAIVVCRSAPPTTWASNFLQFVGRRDLTVHVNHVSSTQVQPAPTGHHFRDLHAICGSADLPDPASTYKPAPDNDRSSITRLIFHEDRRFAEAVRLLDPRHQAVAECKPEPSWTEAEYLDKQKEVMVWVMLRTFALPPGFAMIRYNHRRPLPTEKYHLHGFTTNCLMKPMNNIVTADRTAFTEDKFNWAFFHVGVFAGLTNARDAKGIDTSWIVFNKPPELTNKHAGLLLGLGLNGHLKNLAKWLSFKYLTPKHTMTTVGLLLGLSASFIGTMDALVTRLLSVHVTRMLPPGAAELNLSPFTQTTGLMGIGLLYCNTQHRRMSEIMLSEIEHMEMTDPSEPLDTLRDEGYRLAAGFALGFINLGRGKDLRGLHDMHLLERLLAVAVSTKPVDFVHTFDQATPGAIIAYALIYMKTMNEGIARKIDVPDTVPQFDYVRPDVFLLRTLAKHLIMWHNIRATTSWISQNLPVEFRPFKSLRRVKTLKSGHMPFYNILAGLLWSISLRYAGSGDVAVRDFLLHYLDQFLRLTRLPALRYDAKLTRNTVRNCQDLVALSCATVMAGTGDLHVFRRLRALHGRVNPEVPYGSHLAAHHAIGALFLGAGTHTFGTSDLSVAGLIVAFYPLFPADVADNRAHLQAFRHFWALSAEPRCVVARDVDSGKPVALPLIVTFKDRDRATVQYKSPCLLPSLDSIAQIRTDSAEYWQVTLDFAANPFHLETFRKNQTIHVARRPAHDAHKSLLNATLSSLHTTALLSTSSSSAANQDLKWKWLSGLDILRHFEQSDLDVVLPSEGTLSSGSAGHMGTAGRSLADLDGQTSEVDDRLILGHIAKSSWKRSDLCNLKALFGWADSVVDGVNEEGTWPKWLGREELERLKGIVEERGRSMDT